MGQIRSNTTLRYVTRRNARRDGADEVADFGHARVVESRIERASADAALAAGRLREAKEEEWGRLPSISDLRDALLGATRGASSRIEELREGRKAREMFFDASFKRLREEKRR